MPRVGRCREIGLWEGSSRGRRFVYTYSLFCFKESACNAGDLSLLPGWGRSPGEGNGNPLQDSCLKNPMDRGAWWATVHWVAESDTTEQLTLSLSPFQSFTYFTNLTFLISFISLITRKNLSQSLSPQEWAHQPFHEHCQFSSVAQSCPTLCDPMDCSIPGFPVHHQLPEFTQTHIH